VSQCVLVTAFLVGACLWHCTFGMRASVFVHTHINDNLRRMNSAFCALPCAHTLVYLYIRISIIFGVARTQLYFVHGCVLILCVYLCLYIHMPILIFVRCTQLVYLHTRDSIFVHTYVNHFLCRMKVTRQ
jgi:hypothetical protein